MRVAVRRVDASLPLPEYHSGGAVGFDLVTRVTTVVEPGAIALVPSNVIVAVPEGSALLIVPRSSLPRRKSLVCPHGIGVIDQDYHGSEDEVMVQVMNIGKVSATVERGERIAQGIFVRCDCAKWEEVADHDKPTRGGFGSTGTGTHD